MIFNCALEKKYKICFFKGWIPKNVVITRCTNISNSVFCQLDCQLEYKKKMFLLKILKNRLLKLFEKLKKNLKIFWGILENIFVILEGQFFFPFGKKNQNSYEKKDS